MIASRFSGLNLSSCGRFGCTMRSRTPATVGDRPRRAAAKRRSRPGPRGRGAASAGAGQRSRRCSPVSERRRRRADQRRRGASGRRARPARRPASSQRFWPSAMPSVFQGKPVKTCPRSHSLAVRPTAKARTRAAPGGQSRRASSEAEGRKEREHRRQAEHAEAASAQANWSASTRKAAPSHQRPATK